MPSDGWIGRVFLLHQVKFSSLWHPLSSVLCSHSSAIPTGMLPPDHVAFSQAGRLAFPWFAFGASGPQGCSPHSTALRVLPPGDVTLSHSGRASRPSRARPFPRGPSLPCASASFTTAIVVSSYESVCLPHQISRSQRWRLSLSYPRSRHA